MLVSPGLEITVSDDSQYAPSAVATVPLVILATAQDKISGGQIAIGTQKKLAGLLQAVTSQRELVNTFGQPSFYQTAAGTPIHGHELNEYGLQAAYSALGLTNRAYILRADLDTSQLIGSTNRPVSDPKNGTYWLDITESKWGIFEWNADLQTFAEKQPIMVSKQSDVTFLNNVYYPLDSVGQIGEYAVVLTTTENRLFYKRYDNVWVPVGSNEWKVAHPSVVGNALNPTFLAGNVLTINTVNVVIGNSTYADPTGADAGSPVSLSTLISEINAANITGVTARTIYNRLTLHADDTAKSNGVTADGMIHLVNTTGTPFTTAGVTVGYFRNPALDIAGFASIPNWRSYDTTPRPSGSVWIKTSVIGGGINIAIKQYNAESDSWSVIETPVYKDTVVATNKMDPAGGGAGISAGSVYVQVSYQDGSVCYIPQIRSIQGKTSITGAEIASDVSFVPGHYFQIFFSVLGSDTLSSAIIVGTASTPESVVANILASNIPEISASYNSVTRTITINHVLGGTIVLKETDANGAPTGTILADAGFTTSVPNIDYSQELKGLLISNFNVLAYTYSATRPYTAPEDGALWYYNTPLEVDIMVNDLGGWKGYKNVFLDARGYNLGNTDPGGVIMSPTAPLSQSDGTALVPGDLWLDTGDLENFPSMYRRNTVGRWVAIDKSDQITQNGIVFADARWDTDGTKDPVADPKAKIVDLLTSNYLDLDAPDYRLYPRGMLLFNMRRSGFNVKKFVKNYFNEDDFQNMTLPLQKDAWVTASGLQNDGSMYAGRAAQRSMVVEALKGAIDSNEAIREEAFAFNLIVCPGYPELIPNMVALNNDRKNTAFVIGDTPMDLPASITTITNWVTNKYGGGLSTADPYLGIYYPSGISNDINGNTIMVPPSHVMLRKMIHNDIVSFPWFAPAGLRRGLVDNINDIGFLDRSRGEFIRNGMNQGMRDALYSIAVNPLTILPSAGLVVFGQKTRNPFTSAMDRVNVARLVNYIRTVLARTGDGFLFEPNDQQTRREFKAVVESVFTELVAKRGIYDFLVVCDEENNTSDRIARNELWCDVFIEPMKAVEFIYIPIRLKNPGAIAKGVK